MESVATEFIVSLMLVISGLVLDMVRMVSSLVLDMVLMFSFPRIVPMASTLAAFRCLANVFCVRSLDELKAGFIEFMSPSSVGFGCCVFVLVHSLLIERFEGVRCQ